MLTTKLKNKKTITRMKQLRIPHIEALDANNMAVAETLLEQIGKRDTIEIINWKSQYPYKPITYFNIAYNNEGVFIRYDVQGSMLKAEFYNDHDPVHKDSCVEFFCKLPQSDTYTNFEFNCIGTCQASTRKSRTLDVVPFDNASMLRIKRHSSLNPKPFMELKGHFEWSLTVFIPFDLIGLELGVHQPKLMGNFYKCADETESMHFLSWSPIGTEQPDFHRPEFFGELILE